MLMTSLMVGVVYTVAWMGLDWLFSMHTQDYATIFAVATGAALTTVLWREC